VLGVTVSLLVKCSSVSYPDLFGAGFLATDHKPATPPLASAGERPLDRICAFLWRLTYVAGLCVALVGCADPPRARYVYQDADFGVIGIPQNAVVGKIDYRAEATELMARHFPEGYEIVRAEEVIEGQTTRERTKKTEIDADPNVLTMNQWVKVGKLGRTTSYDEKDQLQLRECRIVYRRKPVGTPGRPGQFAAATTLEPRLYIDPNESLRRPTSAPIFAKAPPVSQPGRDKSATQTESANQTATSVLR
jgi:hypothetical protein